MSEQQATKRPPNNVLRVVRLLGKKERRHLYGVMLVSLAAALIDVLGVGSIAPFLAVATNPDTIQRNLILREVYQVLGFTSNTSFLIALGIAVVTFVVTTSVFKALTRFVVVRFTSQVRHVLTMKLMVGYLQQDYAFFLGRSSPEFVKNVNSEVQLMVTGTLMTFVDMVGYSLQLLLFISFLLFVNPIATLAIAVIVAAVYGTIYASLRGTIKQLGQNRFDLNRERNRVVSETFWGIKDTKLLGVEQVFLNQYEGPSQRLAKNESKAEVAGDFPKFALEAAAFTTILLYVLIVVLNTGTFQNAAVTVGLFAFASYRMIPAMQNLFKALTKMRYGAPAAVRICAEFDGLLQARPELEAPPPRMPFTRDLVVENLRFRYSEGVQDVIQDLSFRVGHHQTVGFAGATGSGKTTLIDLLLGLLIPQSGRILVDGVEIDSTTRRAWQACIGYVSQTIYVSNGTVLQNVAFGVPPDEIDHAQVERVCQIAQIHEHVVTGMNNGYESQVGERGIKLSGGQRQRLGIARALYRNPEVLVFDEATSALDAETEQAVMESVSSLSGKLTLLMIAHRLTTLRACDQIYLLEKGAIVDHGTFEELSARHRSFAEHR